MDEKGLEKGGGENRVENPGWYKKGHGAPGPGRPPGKRKAPVAGHLYRVMRRVLGQEETRDKSPAERKVRKWLNDYPKEFMAKLADLEKAALSASGSPGTGTRGGGSGSSSPSGGGSPTTTDAGGERAEDLIEQLLGEINEP